MLISVVARSKAWVCVRSLAGIVGSNPAGAWIYVVVSVVRCQVEVSVSGLSLIQRSHTECGSSGECDGEAHYGEAMARNRVEARQEKNIL